jgi:hypothetical protein
MSLSRRERGWTENSKRAFTNRRLSKTCSLSQRGQGEGQRTYWGDQIICGAGRARCPYRAACCNRREIVSPVIRLPTTSVGAGAVGLPNCPAHPRAQRELGLRWQSAAATPPSTTHSRICPAKYPKIQSQKLNSNTVNISSNQFSLFPTPFS